MSHNQGIIKKVQTCNSDDALIVRNIFIENHFILFYCETKTGVSQEFIIRYMFSKPVNYDTNAVTWDISHLWNHFFFLYKRFMNFEFFLLIFYIMIIIGEGIL